MSAGGWPRLRLTRAATTRPGRRSLGPVHPRAYGSHLRVLGRSVRGKCVLSLEDAVRKVTSAVADRLGLRERGLLRVGCYANAVVFDPATRRPSRRRISWRPACAIGGGMRSARC